MEVLWNPDKNHLLMKTRGVSFEMVLEKILQNDFIGPQVNPSRKDQYRIIVYFENYPFVVPLVIDDKGNWFLKTIYPSRKEKEANREKNKPF
ncbi:MAG TPA: toxin [Treponemataceae bacterium]|nr:toxin [Treponemataceae bacterium]